MKVCLSLNAEASATQFFKNSIRKARMSICHLIAELLQRVTFCRRTRETFSEDFVSSCPSLPGTGRRAFSLPDAFFLIKGLNIAHCVLEKVFIIAPVQGLAPFAPRHPV
jgi:hypothetical protein